MGLETESAPVSCRFSEKRPFPFLQVRRFSESDPGSLGGNPEQVGSPPGRINMDVVESAGVHSPGTVPRRVGQTINSLCLAQGKLPLDTPPEELIARRSGGVFFVVCNLEDNHR